MALSNHASYLGGNWSEDAACAKKALAYPAGMGEHLIYVLFKVASVVTFFFVTIGLGLYCLGSMLAGTEEEALTKREVRLKVSCLIFGEGILGIGVDLAGLLCPPAAYRAHACLKEHVTRRAFEKWGIIDHDLPSEGFMALNYFSKV